MIKRGRVKGKQYEEKVYPGVLSKLVDDNKGRKVKIIARQLKHGQWRMGLHIQYYHNKRLIQRYIKMESKFTLTPKANSKSDREQYKDLKFIRDAEEAALRDSSNIYLKQKQAGKTYFFSFLKNTHLEKIESDLKSRNKDTRFYHGGNYDSMAMHFKKFLQASYGIDDITLSAIDENVVDDFSNYLKREVSASSVSTYFSRLKAVLNTALRRRMIKYNPALGVAVGNKSESEPVHLTMEEVNQLQNTDFPHLDDKLAFLFACYSGLRFSELKALQYKHYQDGKLVGLREVKTGKLKYIALTQQAKDILEVYKQSKPNHKPDDHVFNLSYQNYKNHIRAWSKKAGIEKNVTTHTAKHTFAINALQITGNLEAVRLLLGHSDIKTTMIYARYLPKDVDDFVKRISDHNSTKLGSN